MTFKSVHCFCVVAGSLKQLKRKVLFTGSPTGCPRGSTFSGAEVDRLVVPSKQHRL
ncbi:hypothetical protein DPMN_075753 [Dreissena polymorpha]|uniref:Uncharacterized protein n=1 Tax=Dreissena polymorpha TaxID=45954 RepID=A0A9D4BLT0_DREPO|nr:hypothetical protein DPMN_075753 [Dreissena polymorpha]